MTYIIWFIPLAIFIYGVALTRIGTTKYKEASPGSLYAPNFVGVTEYIFGLILIVASVALFAGLLLGKFLL